MSAIVAIGCIFGAVILATAFRRDICDPRKGSVKERIRKQENANLRRMRQIVDSHADFTASLIDFRTSGIPAYTKTCSMSIGDSVTLRLISSDKIEVLSEDGFRLGYAYISENDNICRVLKNGAAYEAYLSCKELTHSEVALFTVVTAFYKIKGIPPTRIEVK